MNSLAGSNLLYTITVTNMGHHRTNVLVQDQLPAGFAFVSARQPVDGDQQPGKLGGLQAGATCPRQTSQ